MSWSEAQATARELYTQLRAKHPPGYLRMVLRALERLLNAEERAAEKTKSPPNHDDPE